MKSELHKNNQTKWKWVFMYCTYYEDKKDVYTQMMRRGHISNE